MNNSRLVAVTGASGYVGGRLVGALGQAGIPVRAIVRRHRNWLACEQVELDLTNASASVVTAALDGVDVVVHLAGASQTASDQSAAKMATIAMTGCVADAARAGRVRRVVHVSTVHVYGAQARPRATLTEDLRPEPVHPYAEARFASEQLLARTAGDDVELVVLRMTNSVGAPAHTDVEQWTLVANDLCRQAVTTGELRLRTPGTQWRDFIDLGDACRAIAAACAPVVPAGIYNLGSGRPMTVRSLAGLIAYATAAATGTRPPLVAPDPEPDPPGPHTVAVDRLRALGITAPTPIEGSITETLRFCLDHWRPVHG